MLSPVNVVLVLRLFANSSGSAIAPRKALYFGYW
jgi:hypothetical protein